MMPVRPRDVPVGLASCVSWQASLGLDPTREELRGCGGAIISAGLSAGTPNMKLFLKGHREATGGVEGVVEGMVEVCHVTKRT